MQAQAECLNPIHLISTPITLAVIYITTALDSPSLPYLGSVTTLVGYPRPQRFWPRFNFLSSTSTRIQGLIYESVLPNMMHALEKQIPRDIKNFQDQNYYLLLNDSIGILLSVIQRGRNYAIIVARGAEIKSATLCHRDQRSRISQTLEDVIALQRNCVFSTRGASLTPIKHLNNVKGLIVDTFNLTSRCIFDVDFNKKLLQIFIYMMLDQIETLQNLYNDNSSQDTVKLDVHLFEKLLTKDQYDQLYDLFPHEFAKQKIESYLWRKGGRTGSARFKEQKKYERMFQKRAQSDESRRKIKIHRGDIDSLSDTTEKTEKMPFTKELRSEIDLGESSQEESKGVENTRLDDSKIDERKGRSETGDYTKKRFSIPPLFTSTHKTSQNKEISLGGLSHKSDIESSFSQNIETERDGVQRVKMKTVRVEEIKLMHSEKDQFTTEKRTEEQFSLEEEKEEIGPHCIRGRPQISYTESSEPEERKEQIDQDTFRKPSGFESKALMAGRNSDSSTESWDSSAMDRHFIDEQTHFVIELAMICFPFLQGQPDSFFAAYESILNGYSFISNDHELLTTLEFRRKEKLHQKLQFLFIKALIVTYLRIIRLDQNLANFEDIRETLQDYKIMTPQQFSEAKFEKESDASFGGDLNPTTTYCTVFFQDDIEIHQVRTGTNDFTMFGLKKEYLRNIWSNMLFEIMYINNDNQERNSIQSNRYLLQNLTSQLAQHPLGYCPFTSGPMLLYF